MQTQENDPIQFLIEEHRRNTAIQRCPIKINMDPLKGPVDTKEQVAEKWEAIKQWYKDHPEANAPWVEWENNQKELLKTFGGSNMRLHGVDENGRPCTWEAKPDIINPKAFYGRCILEIQIKNHGEYLRWIKYNGGRKWEFYHTYPAIMRATYDFHTKTDVEIMVNKIVQLLEMGFEVYSARWKMAEEKSQLEQRL